MATGMELVNLIRGEQAEPPTGIRTLRLDATHKWITSLTPGEVDLTWQVDDAYLNLEGAVICSWVVALADQALFFASNSLCSEGEGTRMSELSLTSMENIDSGPVLIHAVIDRRVGDRMFGTCRFTVDGRLMARVTAMIDVTR